MRCGTVWMQAGLAGTRRAPLVGLKLCHLPLAASVPPSTVNTTPEARPSVSDALKRPALEIRFMCYLHALQLKTL